MANISQWSGWNNLSSRTSRNQQICWRSDGLVSYHCLDLCENYIISILDVLVFAQWWKTGWNIWQFNSIEEQCSSKKHLLSHWKEENGRRGGLSISENKEVIEEINFLSKKYPK